MMKQADFVMHSLWELLQIILKTSKCLSINMFPHCILPIIFPIFITTLSPNIELLNASISPNFINLTSAFDNISVQISILTYHTYTFTYLELTYTWLPPLVGSNLNLYQNPDHPALHNDHSLLEMSYASYKFSGRGQLISICRLLYRWQQGCLVN